MKQGSTIVISVILSALTAFAITKLSTSDTQLQHQETPYERVIRTGTLRCGYEYWDGAVSRNEKTNQVYGPWVDMMNAIGDATNLKIEWTSQVGWPDVAAALKSNKIDAMCAGMWTSASKTKEIAFTTPLTYQSIETFARADDHRFDGDLNKINNPNIKIVIIDNDNSDFIARQDFPNAQRIALSSLNGTDSEEMMHVLTGKADICFANAGLWQQFNKANPGKIQRLAPNKSLRIFGNANAINNDDPRLLMLLNAGQQEIMNSGQLDKILDKANIDFPDMFIKPLKPFP